MGKSVNLDHVKMISTKEPEYIKRLRELSKTSNQRMIEMSQFFEGKGPVYKTLYDITDELKRLKIDYLIMGGAAINYYGYKRTFNNIDIIVRREDYKRFELVHGKGIIIGDNEEYVKLMDLETGVEIKFFFSGEK